MNPLLISMLANYRCKPETAHYFAVWLIRLSLFAGSLTGAYLWWRGL